MAKQNNVPDFHSEGNPIMGVANGFIGNPNTNPFKYIACDGNGRINIGSGSAAIKILDLNGVGILAAQLPQDALTPPSAPYPGAVTCFHEGWNEANSWFDMLRCDQSSSDGLTGKAQGVLETNACMRGHNGTNWDRVRSGSNSTDGVSALSNGVLAINAYGRLFNGSTWDRMPGNTSGLYAQGNVASAATDSGNPVKVGAKYNSTEPTFTDGQRGDLQIGPAGHLKTAVRRNVTTLSNISTTYNNVTTTATSGAVDARMYRRAKFYWTVSKANTPTDITVTCQMSPDNTNWFDYRRFYWVKYRFSAAALASTVNECVDIDIDGAYIRFVVTATGTTASNTFTVANATLEIID